MAERLVANEKVAGSTPVSRSKLNNSLIIDIVFNTIDIELKRLYDEGTFKEVLKYESKKTSKTLGARNFNFFNTFRRSIQVLFSLRS